MCAVFLSDRRRTGIGQKKSLRSRKGCIFLYNVQPFLLLIYIQGGAGVKLEELKAPGGERLTRIVQEIVPGKQITMAHVICSPDPVIYQKLGLDPRVDYVHAAVGIITLSPSETAIIAADICMKKSAIEIGFIDRFSGTLIVTGRMADVIVALESVLEYTETVMGFTVCNLTKA